MKTSSAFKTLALLVFVGGASLFTGGCAKTGLEHDFLAPPGYTSSENAQRIGRYIAYDFSQAIDDFDKDVLMTRPSSRLTLWDVSQSD